jgi:hypothetical protein
MIGWMLGGAVDWILSAVRDTLNAVWKLLAATLFHLPDVTGLTQVQALTSRSLLVVNTCYVLAIVLTGLAVMTHGTLQIRYGASELLPRLVIGLGAANFAVPVCTTITTTANALVLALTGQGIATDASLGQVLALISKELTDPVAALLVAVIGVILIVLVLMLLAGWISRFIALILLCGIAPVALACHGSPWTEGAARLWWRCMGGLVLTVILQALALNTSLAILLDPSQDLSRFGLPGGDSTGLLNLLCIVVLLWMTARIPSLVRRYLTQSGGRPNILAAMVRLVIAQQATRGLGHALRAAGAASFGRGAHRATRARHATGRTTGDPLRGFTPPPPRLHAGTHRDDRARHATQRTITDPLGEFLPPPRPPQAGAHRDDERARHAKARARVSADDPLRDLLRPPPSPRRGTGNPGTGKRPDPGKRPGSA